MDVDWSRVAEPQADQYDTEVTLWRRRQLKGLESRPPAGQAPTLFDGAVAIRPLEGPYLRLESLSSAPADDERIRMGERYVRQWPAAFDQFKGLMHAFYPVRDITGTRIPPGSKGSFSHAFESRIGTMCASIEDPVCLAQAFVHEMAHNKLRSLGVMLESAQDLIINDPKDLYPSPILIGKLRPMTAVFHAEYSFIYVTQLDLMMLARGPKKELRDYLLELLERNVSRMEPGLEVIQDNVQVDSIGRPFVDGFMDWARRVIAEGRTILNEERGHVS
jgi:HEXXH motif-containing protein